MHKEWPMTKKPTSGMVRRQEAAGGRCDDEFNFELQLHVLVGNVRGNGSLKIPG